MLDEKKFYLDLIVQEAKDKYPNSINHRDYLSEEDIKYISNYCTISGKAEYSITYNPNSRPLATLD